MNTVARTTIDGRPMAVVGGHDDAVRVWDLATGALHTTLHGHGFGASAVACASVDGAPVAVVGCDKQALVWDLADGTLRATLTGDDRHLFAVACATVDGRAVAVTSSGRALRVWDLATGALRATSRAATPGCRRWPAPPWAADPWLSPSAMRTWRGCGT
ncbi:WD40 repeat domain-containing protein [Streptomyces malaysiensis subsp. malaysiensis]